MSYLLGAAICLVCVLLWYICSLRQQEKDDNKLKDVENDQTDKIIYQFDQKIDQIKQASLSSDEEVINYLSKPNKN